jgi:predicted transcriptional regulator of viral defense system
VTRREQIANISRQIGDIFQVKDVASLFCIPRSVAAQKLSRWQSQGWLARIKRGTYAIVPLDSSTSEQVVEDPWCLVPELFSPCYIGGWSASEHWDLTEQIFQTICVLTYRSFRKKLQTHHHVNFETTKIPPKLMFGTRVVWRNNKKVQVSDPHKTIIDIIYAPPLGAGYPHITDCFQAYIKSDHCDLDILSEYASQLRSGAFFKRLGYLSEKSLGQGYPLTLLCQKRLTAGYAYLDPKIGDSRLVTRWQLFVPRDYL